MSAGADRYPHLFAPLRIGPKTMRNRVVMSGHSMLLGDGHGGIGDRLREYLAARARGGVALVGIESAPVHESSQNYGAQLHLYSDDIVPGLAAAADAVHEAGALLSIILWHGGHNVDHHGRAHALAPSAIPSPDFHEVPKPISTSEIREVVASYGDAARRCREAGVDVIEVQTASNYLFGAFLSPVLNRRTDAYGGSLANRARIVCEALEVTREAAGPDIAVGVRTSAGHFIPMVPDDYGPEDAAEAIAHIAGQDLLDYASVISGTNWAFERLIPPMSQPRLQDAESAASFKEALDIPVFVAGRIRTAAEAEGIISAGQADAVAMARTLIAEPDFVEKVARGADDEIRPCISCNQACLGFAHRALPGTCVVNPVAGRESEAGELRPVKAPRRIAVVGGGPAGMEAARILAERGDRVTLFEAQDRLGGDMRLAGEAPHRGEVLRAVDWWQRELARLGVDVRLGKAIDGAPPEDADHIIWATGGSVSATAVWRHRPHLIDGIPGTESLPHGRDVLNGAADAIGDVLVIDEEGAWAAVSLAESLAARRGVASVTVVTCESALGGSELSMTSERGPIDARIARTGIAVHAGRFVAQVANGVATLTDGSTLGPYSTIVLSTGTAARTLPEDSLAIGDCVAPRGFWAATNDAARLARSL